MYHRLASRYDNATRNLFSEACAEVALRHFSQRGIKPPARVLDLACGTGLLAYEVQESGYQVTGTDLSPEMLELARARKTRWRRQPDFVQGDIRDLTLPGPFSAALCFGDVLNHLLTAEDLSSMLGGVFSVLEPGGLFVCDSNTLDTFRSRLWNDQSPPALWRGQTLETSCSFDQSTGVGQMVCRAVVEGQETAVDTLTERYYSDDDIMDSLLSAGFEGPTCEPFHPLDFSQSAPEIETLKTLWIARKPR